MIAYLPYCQFVHEDQPYLISDIIHCTCGSLCYFLLLCHYKQMLLGAYVGSVTRCGAKSSNIFFFCLYYWFFVCYLFLFVFFLLLKRKCIKGFCRFCLFLLLFFVFVGRTFGHPPSQFRTYFVSLKFLLYKTTKEKQNIYKFPCIRLTRIKATLLFIPQIHCTDITKVNSKKNETRNI